MTKEHLLSLDNDLSNPSIRACHQILSSLDGENLDDCLNALCNALTRVLLDVSLSMGFEEKEEFILGTLNDFYENCLIAYELNKKQDMN